MKRTLTLIALALVAAPAFAADVVSTLCVLYNNQKLYCQQNSFIGLTDEQAKALEKTGMQTLDFASRRQGKGPYSIEWTWAGLPTVITEGHTFGQVNQVLRQGVRWLDDRVTAAEVNRQRGKGKPWGN